MNDELKQSVLNVTEQKIPALIASGGTVVTGISTVMQMIPAVLGAVASLVGIIVSVILCYFAWRKNRAEIAQIKAETMIIERREKERLFNLIHDNEHDG